MKRFFVLITALALLASCRSTRTISKAVSKKDTAVKVAAVPVATNVVDTQQLIRTALQQLQNNHINYKTFSAKVAVDYKGTDGKGYSVNAKINMYKDSAIWVSANAILGIEAMRVLVTKDSVKLLNKLEKVYSARSISYLQEMTSLPLDLYTLQDMIIGNPVFLDSNIIRYSTGNGVINLLSLGQYFKNLVTINEDDKTLAHSKLDDANPMRSRTADLSYGNYESSKGPLFATKRQTVVSEKGRLEIKLDFKNYNFNDPVEFPFSIPKNYKRQ
jgi:outer membrane biogenesis lipoprotein LolB